MCLSEIHPDMVLQLLMNCYVESGCTGGHGYQHEDGAMKNEAQLAAARHLFALPGKRFAARAAGHTIQR